MNVEWLIVAEQEQWDEDDSENDRPDQESRRRL